MSTLFLLISTLLSAFGLGYAKFFGASYLDHLNGGQSYHYVLQAVGAIMTLGPAMAWVLASPIATSCKKYKVIFASNLLACILIYSAEKIEGANTAWLCLFFISSLMGISAAARGALIPLVAKETGRSTVTINAGVSMTFILGLLAGLSAGTYAYGQDIIGGVRFAIGVFALSAFSSLGCRLKTDILTPFPKATRQIFSGGLQLIRRHHLILIASPVLWAVAGAASLAAVSWAEDAGLALRLWCSTLPAFAAIGVMLGSAVSPYFKNTAFKTVACSVMLLAFCMATVPFAGSLAGTILSNKQTFIFVGVHLGLCGILFGISTNLLDAIYLQRVAEEGKAAQGAALSSALISAISAALGLTLSFTLASHWISPAGQFVVLAMACILLLLPLTLLSKSISLRNLMMNIFIYFLRLALSLRYRIRVQGMDQIQADPRGTLILPNHPAEVDPVILMSVLWAELQPRPVVVENFYHMPTLKGLMAGVKALPMPDHSAASGYGVQRRTQQCLQEASTHCRRGGAVLMYPAGKLMRQGLEKIGANSAVERILVEAPNTRIMTVRTRGLWGSRFSAALHDGATPNLVSSLISAIVDLLRYGIIFMPKREVSIEIDIADEFPRRESRLTQNHWLEQWYNRPGEEIITLPPGFTCKNNKKMSKQNSTPVIIESEMQKKIINEIARLCNTSSEQVNESQRLDEDLGMDSLSRAECAAWLEQEMPSCEVNGEDLLMVRDVLMAASQSSPESLMKATTASKSHWEPTCIEPQMMTGCQSLVEAYLRRPEKDSDLILADGHSPAWSRKRSRMTLLSLATMVKHCPGQRVGVLLPASAAAAHLFLALQLAGKVPVMLNWTMGSRNLVYALKTAEITCVISSTKFIDNLNGVDLMDLESHLLFMEDLQAKLSWLDKLNILFQSKLSVHQLLRYWKLSHMDVNQEAVVLFTSGSEANPKGVPLSHRNLMSNIEGALSAVHFTQNDVILGFLPAFHAFGLTITTLLPLLAGIRVVFHANPTQAKALVKLSQRWQVTMVCGTPAFLSGMFRAGRDGSLASLRLVVSGAEKTPASLFSAVAEHLPNAVLCEGYGATECSPVLSINPPSGKQAGVGLPLKGVSFKIVDPENHQVKNQGEKGLLLASGENVFAGYLGEASTPFILIEGHPWYNTGDLAYLDEDGFLILQGRVKRMAKIGGEMISLPALEDALKSQWQNDDGQTDLAIICRDREGEKPEIILITIRDDLDLEAANLCLRKAGFSNLCRLSRLQKIKCLPVLGTGKLDYKGLSREVSEQPMPSA